MSSSASASKSGFIAASRRALLRGAWTSAASSSVCLAAGLLSKMALAAGFLREMATCRRRTTGSKGCKQQQQL